MSARMRLPARRAAETLTLEFAGLRYTMTIGHFPDGSPGEVFIANHKAGNASDTAVRDAGILISLLLQHGCAAEVIADAVSRDGDGTPSGVIGAVLDLITRRGPTVKILGVDPGIHSGLAIVTLSDDAAPPLIAAPEFRSPVSSSVSMPSRCRTGSPSTLRSTRDRADPFPLTTRAPTAAKRGFSNIDPHQKVTL